MLSFFLDLTGTSIFALGILGLCYRELPKNMPIWMGLVLTSCGIYVLHLSATLN